MKMKDEFHIYIQARQAKTFTNMLVLSTSNIIARAPSLVGSQKSNVELITGIRTNCGDQATRDGVTFVPQVAHQPLQEERSAYNIIAKLFILPGSKPTDRNAQITKAIQLVLDQLGIDNVDLLIVSFPEIVFDDETTDGSVVSTWKHVERLPSKALGVAEFSLDQLSIFLQHVKVRPTVNQVFFPDGVSKELKDFARQEGIELHTHNDCTDVLPQGTFRELVEERGLQVGELTPLWVIKYTAIIVDRGVIENKGYFAAADV